MLYLKIDTYCSLTDCFACGSKVAISNDRFLSNMADEKGKPIHPVLISCFRPEGVTECDKIIS